MKKILTFTCVVAASSLLGVGLGRLIADSRRTKAMGQASGVIAKNEPRPVAEPDPAAVHARFSLDGVNHGARGQLGLKATFAIGKPNTVGRDRKYDVTATVIHIESGAVSINNDVIGHCADVVGKGQWEQDFEVTYNLPPGEYIVDLWAYEPGKVLTVPGGTDLPSGLGTRRTYTVK